MTTLELTPSMRLNPLSHHASQMARAGAKKRRAKVLTKAAQIRRELGMKPHPGLAA